MSDGSGLLNATDAPLLGVAEAGLATCETEGGERVRASGSSGGGGRRGRWKEGGYVDRDTDRWVDRSMH